MKHFLLSPPVPEVVHGMLGNRGFRMSPNSHENLMPSVILKVSQDPAMYPMVARKNLQFFGKGGDF